MAKLRVTEKIIRFSSGLCTHAPNYQRSCGAGIITASGSEEKALLHLEQLVDVAGPAVRHAEWHQLLMEVASSPPKDL